MTRLRLQKQQQEMPKDSSECGRGTARKGRGQSDRERERGGQGPHRKEEFQVPSPSGSQALSLLFLYSFCFSLFYFICFDGFFFVFYLPQEGCSQFRGYIAFQKFLTHTERESVRQGGGKRDRSNAATNAVACVFSINCDIRLINLFGSRITQLDRQTGGQRQP